MASAVEEIANGFVRVKDRAALERMREHRNRLLQEYRMRPAQWFRSEVLETSLQDDVAVLAVKNATSTELNRTRR